MAWRAFPASQAYIINCACSMQSTSHEVTAAVATYKLLQTSRRYSRDQSASTALYGRQLLGHTLWRESCVHVCMGPVWPITLIYADTDTDTTVSGEVCVSMGYQA